jgi:predicted component of type VI protein secretion system
MKYSVKPILIITAMAALLVSIACSNQSNTGSTPTAPPAFLASKSASRDMAYAPQTNDAGGSGEAATQDRKIVRTGSITMEVSDIGKSQADITDFASQYKGYVVSSNQRADQEYPTGYISIRIPAASFNDVMQKIRALALKVTYENTNSQDVTEQYMDLAAQLKNYQATETQYLELLKKADNVKDILEVQRELSNVRGNIERVKGRMQYLERTSDMSLIEVTLNKSKPIGQSTWDVAGIFKSAVDGLIVLGKALLGILIWLVVFSPVWIIVLVIIFVIRRKKKAQAKSATPK